ncbi:MAG: hypothetical protein Alpg2KO_25320 [Alphaproteobacteria bacterium]
MLKSLFPALSLAAILAMPGLAQATDYTVDYAASEVAFTGEHAGNTFKGVFQDWKAEITFDPDDLANSTLSASFKTNSAKTGDQTYDGTMPSPDWFNSSATPDATFVSESITANPDGSYKATGPLTLRGLSRPVSFDFVVSDLATAPVTATAEFSLARMTWNIGAKSDPDAEWVSSDIGVSLKIVASPANP